MAPVADRAGVKRTAHDNVVRVENDAAIDRLEARLSELDLTLDEFCRRGHADELDDDRARMLWLMYGPDLCT